MSELLEALRLHKPLPSRVIDHDAAAAAFAALQTAKAARRAALDADFGPYRGHPMDPRTPEPEDDTDPVRASDMAMELAGRADRAWQSGDRAAAADLYRSAAQMLQSAADVAGAL